MTVRLQEALRRLTPDAIERLTEYAESLARTGPTVPSGDHLKLDWAGQASAAYPEYESGVDAAHAAMAMLRDALDKRLSK
jgi:hypothetical protein